jgi:hypothetical protein
MMAIERDICEEHQTRLDRMIAEFRDAQTRRGMRETKVVKLKPDTNTTPPSSGSDASE